MSDGEGGKLATGWLELVVATAGAESQIAASIVPGATLAGDAAGLSMGSRLLGGLKTFAAPIAALAAGFGIVELVKSSEAAFSDLASSTRTLQRVAGGTTEQVSGLAGALQLSGVTGDQTSTALRIFSKNLGNAAADGTKTADMAKLLGGSFLDASGQVKPLSEIMPQLADKFESMPNGAEKTALAMQLFGRSGANIIPFLNNGSAGIAEFTAKAQAMGLVIDDQAENTWLKGIRAQRLFAAAVQGSKAALGQDLVPVLEGVEGIYRQALTPVLQSVTGYLTSHRDAFISVGESLEHVGEIVGGKVTSGLSVLGKIFGQVSATVGPVISQLAAGLGPLFTELGPVFASLGPQVLAFASAMSPVHLILTAIAPVLPNLIGVLGILASSLGSALGSALTAILPALTHLATLLSSQLTGVLQIIVPLIGQMAGVLGGALATAFRQVGPVLGQVVSILAGTLASVLPALTPIITLLAKVFADVFTAISPLIPTLLQLLTPILGLITPLLQLVGPILTPLIQLFSALLAPILSLIAPLVNLLVPILQPLIDLLTTVATVMADGLAGAIKIIGDLLTGNFSGALKDSRDLTSKIWADITGYFTKAQADLKNILGAIGSFFAGIWNGIEDRAKSFVNFFAGIPSTVRSLFDGAATWLVNVGRDLIQGLLNGASSLLRNIGSFFLRILPGWIVGPFKAALGIHSPSTVFAGFADNTVDGYVNQIARRAGDVGASITKMAGQATMSASPAFAGRSSSPAAAAGFVNNGTIQVTDEQALVGYVAQNQRRANALAGLAPIAAGGVA